MLSPSVDNYWICGHIIHYVSMRKSKYKGMVEFFRWAEHNVHRPSLMLPPDDGWLLAKALLYFSNFYVHIDEQLGSLGF